MNDGYRAARERAGAARAERRMSALEEPLAVYAAVSILTLVPAGVVAGRPFGQC